MSDKNNNDDLKQKLQEQLKKYRGANPNSPNFNKEDDSSEQEQKNYNDSSKKDAKDDSQESKEKSNPFKFFMNDDDDDQPRKSPRKEFKMPSFFKNFNGSGLSKIGAAIAIVALGTVLVFKNFYTVNESEEGVVTRFGALHQVTLPGLNWKIPFIDSVQLVNVRRVTESRIEGTILTKDENVVNVELTVQYRIADPAKYLFNIDQPIKTIQEAAESSLRYVVGHMNMDEVLTTGRSEVRASTRTELEKILDRYQTGIEIVDVNFQYARPPVEPSHTQQSQLGMLLDNSKNCVCCFPFVKAN